MKKNHISINIISSFNHANFVSLLNASNDLNWEINEVDYNQVFQTLTNPNEKIWKKKANITLVWTTPDLISAEFQKLQNKIKVDSNIIKKEVEYFCSILKSIKNYSDIVLIPNWILKQPSESNLASAYNKDVGLEYNLALMNYYLSNNLSDEKNFFILNSSKWLSNCGVENAYSNKLWYLMKTPFSNNFFKESISDLLNIYWTTKGQSKKLLILDLDDTLWGGVVGEVGWKNLRIGGHDYLGEAFRDFQTKIKSLKENGVILAIASKNEESIAVEAIKKHPEMILSMDDFVAYKINWQDKAKNIAEIVSELNLGLQSVVFLDDNIFERERVKAMLPEVYVPDLPKDPTDFSTFLSKLHCFDLANITKEDKTRGNLYKSEFKRTKLKEKFESLFKWIETLNLHVSIENIKNENLPRSLQLLNKTNQMNFSTRRLTEKEFKDWINKKTNYLWTIRAKDKFGEYGIIGILSISVNDKKAYLVDFVLSCRVVGRYIEDLIIKYLQEFCIESNISEIKGTFKKTEKNLLCFNFFKKLNVINENNHSFILPSNRIKIDLPKISITKPFFENKK